MLLNGLSAGGGAYVGPGSYTNQSSRGTATWASPQGPQTATEAGFGTVAGGSGVHRITHGVLSVGVLALGALIWVWWSLPR